MIELIAGIGDRPLRVLCLGAHCDDIEIGCGATLTKLLSQRAVSVDWHVFSSNPLREAEARSAADRILAGASDAKVSINTFRNGYFPHVAAEIKDYFETIKTADAPDVVFTHYKEDLHQDHRTIGELTWNTFRNHLILEYEIPKYDGGLGSPNVFSAVDKEQVERKVSTIIECFKSQDSKPWFEAATFQSLMRLRGVECNSASGYAEAFYARKVVFGCA